MTQPTTPHPAKKLSLPHGDASTDAIDIDDIHSVQVILSGDGEWIILIVLKSGASVVAELTQDNIAYLASLGFELHYPLGRPEPESKPKGPRPGR